MIRLCSASIGLTDVSDVFGASVDPGIAAQVFAAAGDYQGSYNAVIRQLLKVGFSTRNITLLESPSYTTGKLFFREEVEGDVAGSNYISLSSVTDKCLVLPGAISWSAGGMASLSVMMHFFSSDGSTVPLTVGTASGDLSAVTSVYTGALDCVENINLNYGFSIRPCRDGHLYGSKPYIVEQRPTLSITTSDESQVTAARIAPGVVEGLTASFAPVAEGGVRGTARNYALTGHVTRQVSGGNPSLITLSCQGKGGFTIS